MKIPLIPTNENERLAALDRYKIVDTLPEKEYDDLTQIAADICDTEIALISLVDRDRQWFKSRFGIDVSETSRDISFCGHVVALESILIVPDATKDERFANNPLVQDDPKIRFYAGVPLITPDNYILGTLCVIDYQPKNLNSKQIQQLQVLGSLVISQLELRLKEFTAKEMQKQLFEIAMFQKAILDSANFSIISTDLEGIIKSFNTGAEALLGYTEAEILGKTPASFHDFNEISERAALLSTALQQNIEAGFEVFIAKAKLGEVFEEEWTYIHKNGNRIPVLLSITAICSPQDGITGYLGIAKDITAQKIAEAELQASNEKLALSNIELMRASSLKDEFLSVMSHELRTPLNAILGLTEAFQDHAFGLTNQKQLTALNTIATSGKHLLGMIEDILNITNIAAGRFALNLSPSSIDQICQTSLSLIQQSALQKKIKVVYKIQPNLPYVEIDCNHIQQVLIKLLSNAVKFTPTGGSIELQVDTHCDRQDSDCWLRLAVMDTGIGIAEEHISILFEPFTQLDSKINRQYNGSGIGLTFVKKIIELHGGRVGVISEIDKGSCFTIELPLREGFVPIAETALEIPSSSVSPPLTTSPLIFLVADNEVNLSTIFCYLEAKSFRVQGSCDHQNAFANAQLYQPDMMVIDLKMSNIDVLETIKQIRLDSSLANIPIIAMTDLAIEGDREKFLEVGITDYLMKPVKLKALVQTIAKYI
ncbi:PAS domain S-box protein [Pseudanabaena sp. FACHB-1998]|uniref:ATP-binding protein n=1 Tax=Pseudanabaena sp. FACHB-1998 TaxID=2692858 RepID=UPI001680B6ED|nr:ATP-binding protein [Pseudanabaena sp. FACHB-1998]MBD2176310.1 PAS domain S-box protein [Pseudanabaena sp. FACHB-1998]